MAARFPEATQKNYLVALKKIVGHGGVVIRVNNSRFKLEAKFKQKALKRMEKGLPIKKVLSSDAMVDKVKKAIKKKKPAQKKKPRAKKQDAKKGGKANSKSAGKGRSKASAAKKD